MDFQPVERASEAFQQSLTADEIGKVCARALGGAATPVSVVEMGTGKYNSVYRVTLAGRAEPVILRVAPPESRQFRGERRLMRNEHANQPWLAVIAPLMPQVIAAGGSHQVSDRDRMIQWRWLPPPPGTRLPPRPGQVNGEAVPRFGFLRTARWRRGRPRLPRTGGTAWRSGINWVTSLRLPPVKVAASGMPVAPVIK